MTFLMYAIMCALSFVFCYYKVPETTGVTLEEIENNIRKRMPLREIGQKSGDVIHPASEEYEGARS